MQILVLLFLNKIHFIFRKKTKDITDKSSVTSLISLLIFSFSCLIMAYCLPRINMYFAQNSILSTDSIIIVYSTTKLSSVFMFFSYILSIYFGILMVRFYELLFCKSNLIILSPYPDIVLVLVSIVFFIFVYKEKDYGLAVSKNKIEVKLNSFKGLREWPLRDIVEIKKTKNLYIFKINTNGVSVEFEIPIEGTRPFYFENAFHRLGVKILDK